MQSHKLVVFFCLLALMFIVSSCAPSSSSPAPASTTTTTQNGATLVQERCSVCHPLSRVESARFSAADWKAIVDTMIARGAQLTPEEETIVVNYLVTNFGK